MRPQKCVFPSLSFFVSILFYQHGEAMMQPFQYSLARSALPLSDRCKSLSRKSLLRTMQSANNSCLEAFVLLDESRYNICNGWSSAECRFIQPPGSAGTFRCTVYDPVSNAIRSFEDCAPALGLPTFGEGSTTTPSVHGGGFSTMSCFATPRMQTEDPRKKRRLSPSPPPPPTILESYWVPPILESSRVKESNTRPRNADATFQGQSRSRRTSPPAGQYPQHSSGLLYDPSFSIADLDGAETQYTIELRNTQPGTSHGGSEVGHFSGSRGVDEAAPPPKWYNEKATWKHQYPKGNVCPVCNAVFQKRKQLLFHLPTHDERTSCSICGKSFKTIGNKNKHEKIHKRN